MSDSLIQSSNRNSLLHGIAWEEKCWLVYKVQNGICPLCLEPLDAKGANIDHCHACVNKGAHVIRELIDPDGTRRRMEYGCRLCIRGALHAVCNGRMLPYLERYPHLQNDIVREYLARRPFVWKGPPNKSEESS